MGGGDGGALGFGGSTFGSAGAAWGAGAVTTGLGAAVGLGVAVAVAVGVGVLVALAITVGVVVTLVRLATVTVAVPVTLVGSAAWVGWATGRTTIGVGCAVGDGTWATGGAGRGDHGAIPVRVRRTTNTAKTATAMPSI